MLEQKSDRTILARLAASADRAAAYILNTLLD
jgi:hypothetical protein